MSIGEQRIKELYEAVLKHPPGERASYIARAAGDDTELRERVQALLSGQQDTVLPGYEPGSADAEQLLSAGTQIGSYRIDGPLGAGGMGVVYFATDTKLNRPAAIKVLPENLADPEARRRFQQEAQLVSSLNHPHIVTVYDAGEYEGRQYLITEYVDGGTLRQWAQRPRGWRAIVELLVGVADGIAVAHAAGILHRDIKPENILLAKNGYAKLADFGIAKLLESDPLAEDSAPPRGSEHSTHLGTVAYMSPEQWQGLALDARSDVYSFGLVLYELLSGGRPFADRESGALADPGTPPPLGGDLPPELRTSVAKALEPEAADRYQSMRDLVVDLRRLARGSAIDANRMDKAEAAAVNERVSVQPRRAWTRRLGYLFAMIAVLAVGILARDYARNAFNAAPGRKTVAVLPFANESASPDDVSITERLSDKLRERLQELPDLDVVGRVSSVSFRGEQVDMRTIANTLGVGLLINGSLQRQGRVLHLQVEIVNTKGFAVRAPLQFERAEGELLAMQQEMAAEIGAWLAPGSAAATVKPAAPPTAQNASADSLIRFGSHWENEVKDELYVDEEKLQKAIDFYRAATLADPASIEAYSRLAGALLYSGDVQGASEPLKQALKLGESLDPNAKSKALSDARYAAGLYLFATRNEESGQQFERAIALDPSNVDALGAYAQWLMWHRRAPEADRYFREAIGLDRRSLARYVDYAEYLGSLERTDQLREIRHEIEERFPSARGYLKLARLYELSGDLDIGIAWGLKAYRQLPQTGETASQRQLKGDARGQIAELYARIGDFVQAAKFEPIPGIGQLFLQQRYDGLISVAQDMTFDHPNDLDLKYFLAFGYNATGDFSNAKYVLEGTGFPLRVGTTRDALEAQAQTYYIDALQWLGGDEARVQELATLALAFYGNAPALENDVWVNMALACSQSQLDHTQEALTAIDRIYGEQGLASSPLLEDSPCFKRLASQPRYIALIEHLKERQKTLRERLPETLSKFGVADVQP